MPNAKHPYTETVTFAGRVLPLKRPMAEFAARRLQAILPQIAALNAAGKSQGDAAAALETTVTTLRQPEHTGMGKHGTRQRARLPVRDR